MAPAMSRTLAGSNRSGSNFPLWIARSVGTLTRKIPPPEIKPLKCQAPRAKLASSTLKMKSEGSPAAAIANCSGRMRAMPSPWNGATRKSQAPIGESTAFDLIRTGTRLTDPVAAAATASEGAS